MAALLTSAPASAMMPGSPAYAARWIGESALQSVAPTGAVIWYAMGNSLDSSGNGNDVSFVSNVTFSGVAYFSGTNNYLKRNAFAAINLYTQFTISVWARNLPWNDNFPRLIERGANTEIAWVWNQFTSRKIGLYRSATIISGTDVITHTTNQWMHYVVVHDASADNVYKIYLDNTNVYTSGNVGPNSGRTNDLYIGGNTPLADTTDYGGYLDNFRYYSRALTTNEIQKLFDEGHDEIP